MQKTFLRNDECAQQSCYMQSAKAPAGAVDLWLTRQFLPGYFHSPLSGLDRVYRNGIAVLQEQSTFL
jgi:hypothetical protein